MPESGVTKHNYLFCQFVNPARGHEGDRCDCFDTPSQRRTTLAKQRLARLRANREINRASTSNDTESAVASDPAVTVVVGLTNERSYRVPVGGRLSRLYVCQKLRVAWSVQERPSRPGGEPGIRVPGDEGIPLKSPGS